MSRFPHLTARWRVTLRPEMRPLGLTLVLAAVVYAAFSVFADGRALRASLASVDPLAVLAALALSSANYAVRYSRWELYLTRLDVRIPWRDSAVIFTAGLTMSITPGKLGEAWKSLLLEERHAIPVTRTAGIVLAERLTDLLALLLLLSLAAWKALDPRLGATTLALTIALWAFFVVPAASRPLVAALTRLRREALAERVSRFIASTSALLTPALLAKATLIACVGWALEAYALTLLARGLGHPVGVSQAVFIYATATLAGGLAMIPGGLGVTEGSMVALLARALPNASSPERLALTLLSRFTTLWWGVSLGLLALGLFARGRRASR